MLSRDTGWESHTDVILSFSTLDVIREGAHGKQRVCVCVPWSAVCAAWPARACLWRAAADSGRAPSWPPPDLHTLRLAPHTAAAAPPSGPRRAASPAATHTSHTHESYTDRYLFRSGYILRLLKAVIYLKKSTACLRVKRSVHWHGSSSWVCFQCLTVNDPLELHLHQLWDAQTHHEKHWLTEKTLVEWFISEKTCW